MYQLVAGVCSKHTLNAHNDRHQPSDSFGTAIGAALVEKKQQQATTENIALRQARFDQRGGLREVSINGFAPNFGAPQIGNLVPNVAEPDEFIDNFSGQAQGLEKT